MLEEPVTSEVLLGTQEQQYSPTSAWPFPTPLHVVISYRKITFIAVYCSASTLSRSAQETSNEFD